ncbi:MAG TPA: hypothetical protein VNL38_01545 [Candidatus Nitrosotenuis sp.]|nr:hypothetical protein [Candidatus Nitrosotenuis sp.]
MSKRKIILCLALLLARGAFAQQTAKPQAESSGGKASDALAAVLVAACRQNEEQFAQHLTKENAATFREMPPEQKRALMRRIVQLVEAGRPLLSTGAEGRAEVRCDTPAVAAVFRLGEERAAENLAFVPVEVNAQRRTEFGLVREGGGWRLLSVGLLLLNLPELARQWAQDASRATSEEKLEPADAAAVAALQDLHFAVQTYKKAFGHLPESLAQLGPAERGQVSPDRANLIGDDLSMGRKGGYVFAYRVVPPKEKDGAPSFVLTATPEEYGRSGKWSFCLDEAGELHGADKQGAAATSSDPKIEVK